jgi:predicted AAA+ superfamily ATPase
VAIFAPGYQAIRLPAYSVNRTRRLIKAPKLYWSDTALAMHLAGETQPRGRARE